MATETFANTASSTLNGAYTSGGSSIVVTSASTFPTTGNFRVLIDSEIMLVTAVSGTTFTVSGAQEGTSAANHSNGAAVTHLLTKGALQAIQHTRPRVTNASASYTVVSTDALILHNHSGSTSYIVAATDGLDVELQDITGAIGTLANNVFIVPAANEKINTSTGFALSGTAYHFTNGSGTVTATSSKFQSELAVGMSIQSSNQSGVNYLVSAIASDTSLTISVNFSGTTTTTATATRTSLTFAANFGRLFIRSDGADLFVKGDGTPTTVSFTTSGTFIPPAGLTQGEVYAAGGGGGGGGGINGANNLTGRTSGAGGGGALEEYARVALTGNTAITVTIGAAGSAGAAGATSGGNGGTGGTTSFGSQLSAAGGSGASAATGSGVRVGGANAVRNTIGTLVLIDNTGQPGASFPGNGGESGAGNSAQIGLAGNPGNTNLIGGFAAGAAGNPGAFSTTQGSAGGGGGGGAGPRGAGGNGGTGGDGEVTVGGASGSGTVGGSGGANTGAGGGGGGSGGNGTGSLGSGANGGAGGSGYLDVVYVL